MIPAPTEVVEGVVLGAAPLVDEEAFEHECWRLYEAAVAAIGHDPVAISDLVWRICGNPHSSVSHIPQPYAPKETVRPTPALLANLPARRPIA